MAKLVIILVASVSTYTLSRSSVLPNPPPQRSCAALKATGGASAEATAATLVGEANAKLFDAARRLKGRAGPLRRRVREHGAPTQRVGRDGRYQNDDELGHLGSCSARGAVVPGVRVEIWQHLLRAGS